MKFFMIILLIVPNIHAATPFVYSGELINSVFESSKVNQAVAGMVNKIEVISFDTVTNLHTVKFSSDLCNFTAFVKDVGDGMNHKFRVTTTRLDTCKPR